MLRIVRTLSRPCVAVRGASNASSSSMFAQSVEEAAELTQTLARQTTRTEAVSRFKMIKTSIQKLKEVCRQVRGMGVDEALRQMEANPRKVGRTVHHCLVNARNNAQHLGLPVEDLVISGYTIGRGTPMKRIDFKAKGRIGLKQRYRTNLVVHVAPMHLLPGARWEKRRENLAIREARKRWRRGEVQAPVPNPALYRQPGLARGGAFPLKSVSYGRR